jgi:hypothetical protein
MQKQVLSFGPFLNVSLLFVGGCFGLLMSPQGESMGYHEGENDLLSQPIFLPSHRGFRGLVFGRLSQFGVLARIQCA